MPSVGMVVFVFKRNNTSTLQTQWQCALECLCNSEAPTIQPGSFSSFSLKHDSFRLWGMARQTELMLRHSFIAETDH